MNSLLTLTTNISSKFQDISLLLIRLILAYGFYEPALTKIKDISSVSLWFESLGIPYPMINAYMAASTEILGVVLLTLGLFTRLISLPLIIIMIVAITTVHISNGFSAGDNGFEIPLYYMIMLFVLFTHGAGKYSFDNIIFKNK